MSYLWNLIKQELAQSINLSKTFIYSKKKILSIAKIQLFFCCCLINFISNKIKINQ